MDVLLVGALLLPTWAAAASPPHLCLADPPMALQAGSSVASVVLDGGPVGRPCKALLSFADPDFLPVSYYFDPLPCLGRYLASFLVPAGAPNGDAFVTWQCAGLQPLCSHARISGGSGDPAIDLENAGTAACVSEFLQTTTTLVTSTASSSVLVESHRAIVTATSTSFHAAGSVHAVGSGAQTKPGVNLNRSGMGRGREAPPSSSTLAGLMERATSSSASSATPTGLTAATSATRGPPAPPNDAGAARSAAVATPPVSNILLATLAANTRRTETGASASTSAPTPATMPTAMLKPPTSPNTMPAAVSNTPTPSNTMPAAMLNTPTTPNTMPAAMSNTPTTPQSAARPDGLFQEPVSSASRLPTSPCRRQSSRWSPP